MATKPRKFDAVLKGLQKSEPADLEYQEKVNIEKDRLRSGAAALADERMKSLDLANDLRDWLVAWGKDGAPESHTPESLARLYIHVTDELERLEAVRYYRQMRLTAIEQMLIDSHEANQPGWGLYGAAPHTVKLASGACLDVQPEPEAKVEDRESFRLWCIANGLEEKLQLWPSTMAAIAKERLLEGLAPPDGVAIKVRSKVKYRRAK